MPRISRWSPATEAPTRCPASRRIDSTSVRYSSPWLLSVRTLPSASLEQPAVEREHPGVDLPDRTLRVGGVLVLDDLGDRAGGRVADDPAVAGRVRDLGGQHGDGVGVGVVRGGERGERLAGEQRGVPADDDRRCRRRCRRAPPGPSGPRGRCRSARPGRRCARAVVPGGEVRGDLLAGVADDDDEVLGVELTGGGDDMSDERAPGDLVQDLGCLRLHAGALTRCEDDDGGRAVGAHGMCPSASGGGTSAGYRGRICRKRARAPTGEVGARACSSPARTRTLTDSTKSHCAANYTTGDMRLDRTFRQVRSTWHPTLCRTSRPRCDGTAPRSWSRR